MAIPPLLNSGTSVLYLTLLAGRFDFFGEGAAEVIEKASANRLTTLTIELYVMFVSKSRFD